MTGPVTSRPATSGPGRIVAIGGGKGGVGKSLLCANLAIAWARQGRRVIALDADLGSANLHTCLGVEAPRKSLSHFIRRSVDTLREILTPTPISGLSLISGARDPLDAANPAHQQKMRLLRHLARLDCDDLLIDLGAGSSFNVLDFFLFAELGVLVVTPEPTSADNATRFLKAIFLRQLKRVQRAYGFKTEIAAAIEVFHQRGLSRPRELLQCVCEHSHEAGQVVTREMQKLRPALVVNQCRELDDHRLGERLRHTANRTLGVDLQLVGVLPYDEAVFRALRRRRALLIDAPGSDAARALLTVSERLGGVTEFRTEFGEAAGITGAKRGARMPGACQRRATKPVISRASMAPGGIQGQPLATILEPVPAAVCKPGDDLQQPRSVLDSAGSYDGPMLKVVRQARGLNLRDLSTRTKIPISKLQAIERDDASVFPAAVYLRGFVQQYARALGLDGERVARAYLKHLQQRPSTGNH